MEKEHELNEIICYNGPFSIKIISALANHIMDYLRRQQDIAVMKFYRVFIEMLQNMSSYSAKRIQQADGITIGMGKAWVFENEKVLKCKTENLIYPEHKDILFFNCNRINTSSVESLKSLKEELRRVSTFQDTGAHIGLISISLNSGNKLEFCFENQQVGNLVSFSISATISKTNN